MSTEAQGQDDNWLDATARKHLSHSARRPSRREYSRISAVRQWYGAEARGVLDAHRPQTQHVGNMVDSVLRQLGASRNHLFEDLSREWADIVGADLAKHTAPAEVDGKVLLVEVASAPWLYALQTMYKQDLLGKVRARAGGRIEDVRFTPQGRIRR
jgi:hypothetical protein